MGSCTSFFLKCADAFAKIYQNLSVLTKTSACQIHPFYWDAMADVCCVVVFKVPWFLWTVAGEVSEQNEWNNAKTLATAM